MSRDTVRSPELRPAAVRHIERESSRIMHIIRKLMKKSCGPDAASSRSAAFGSGSSATAGKTAAGAAESPSAPVSTGMLLAAAFPDRIGRRNEFGSWQLSGGGQYDIRRGQVAFSPQWIVAIDIQRRTRGGIINLAAGLVENEAARLIDQYATSGDQAFVRDGKIHARRVKRLGEIILSETPLQLSRLSDPAAAITALVHEQGAEHLGWSPAARRLQSRLLFLHAQPGSSGHPPVWPDVSDQSLAAQAPEWLPAFLPRHLSPDSLQRINMHAVLMSRIPWQLQAKLDELAPESVTLPSGSRQKLRYEGGRCILSARIQQLFGMMESPRAAGQPVEVELLSPARRPVQITRDLASFWRTTYAEVRKELRGRYPKHYWPEDPGQAEPTDRVRPRK